MHIHFIFNDIYLPVFICSVIITAICPYHSWEGTDKNKNMEGKNMFDKKNFIKIVIAVCTIFRRLSAH